MHVSNGYSIQIKVVGSRFYALIPELCIIAEGDSIAAAYTALEEKRSQIVAAYEKAGFSEQLPKARTERASKPLLDVRALAMFSAKAVVVAVAIGLSGAMLARSAQTTIKRVGQEVVEATSGMKGRQFWAKIGDGIVRAAENERDPAYEEKIRQSLRVIVSRYQPFAAELSPLFGCSTPRDPKAP